MKGHHPTPPDLAERMVRGLFEDLPPERNTRILYPGCGTAPFAEAVEHVCDAEGWPLPEGYALDSDPELLSSAKSKELTQVTFEERDFLSAGAAEMEPFDYIVGNPPYVPIEALSEEEKAHYRSSFATAVGRFDLYLLFFERALDLLAPGGRLSFVTPEKWEYVQTAAPLRRLLSNSQFHVVSIEHVAEDAFDGLVTYPTVTTVQRLCESSTKRSPTHVRLREGTEHMVTLPEEESDSWAALVRGADVDDLKTGVTLGDVTVRVSPGMATGADRVFVMKRDEVPAGLDPEWIRPTVSGRQLVAGDAARSESVLICPYRDDGTLVPESKLGVFGEWVSGHRKRLENRSCVQKHGKAWYAWHENPPMQDLLQPKIVFKDITSSPEFWPERVGDVVPRHSVYYLVPKEGVEMDALLEHLNTPQARAWMEAHCQRAANGFLRLQSRVLRKLPVPEHLQPEAEENLQPALF